MEIRLGMGPIPGQTQSAIAIIPHNHEEYELLIKNRTEFDDPKRDAESFATVVTRPEKCANVGARGHQPLRNFPFANFRFERFETLVIVPIMGIRRRQYRGARIVEQQCCDGSDQFDCLHRRSSSGNFSASFESLISAAALSRATAFHGIETRVELLFDNPIPWR
ncbi:MAG: hypothetical protein KDA84_08140, partial [Planctomycetaceae bacterium]|nr:hypothetical protein [Planctomycetaceae bacterium]